VADATIVSDPGHETGSSTSFLDLSNLNTQIILGGSSFVLILIIVLICVANMTKKKKDKTQSTIELPKIAKSNTHISDTPSVEPEVEEDLRIDIDEYVNA